MNKKKTEILNRVELWVKEKLEANPSMAHDWFHIDRVRKTIIIIAESENIDTFLPEVTALLHDVGRIVPEKGNHGHISAKLSKPLLIKLGFCKIDYENILYAVRNHNSELSDTFLLRILRDADMLDAMGAVGLIRSFMTQNGLPLYNPDILFNKQLNEPPKLRADYVCRHMTWLNRMHTKKGKQLAQQRIDFMKTFVEQVNLEIRGNTK